MKHHLSTVCLLASLSCFPLLSLAATNDNNSSANSANHSGLTAQQKQDGEIIGILTVINSNEINAAKEAENRAVNADVKHYAQTMDKDHSENLQDVKKLTEKNHLNPVNSDEAASLQKDGQDELKELKSEPDDKFDLAYMEAMVDDHQEALTLIDTNLLKNVSNPDLNAHLQKTRDAVANHLQMAKDIVNKLKQ